MVLGLLTAEQTAAVFTAAWDSAAARTWNRHRSTLRSFTAWAATHGWITADLAALLEYRPPTRDRTRASEPISSPPPGRASSALAAICAALCARRPWWSSTWSR